MNAGDLVVLDASQRPVVFGWPPEQVLSEVWLNDGHYSWPSAPSSICITPSDLWLVVARSNRWIMLLGVNRLCCQFADNFKVL